MKAAAQWREEWMLMAWAEDRDLEAVIRRIQADAMGSVLSALKASHEMHESMGGCCCNGDKSCAPCLVEIALSETKP